MALGAEAAVSVRFITPSALAVAELCRRVTRKTSVATASGDAVADDFESAVKQAHPVVSVGREPLEQTSGDAATRV